MSKINIRDLFSAQKKDNSSTQSVAESADPSPEAIEVAFNKQTEVPEWTSASSDFVNFKVVESPINEIPDFFSEASTVSLLSGVDPATGRIVAALGANLCLARGDSLWILDMTTGMSNDRSISCIKRPIRDMELTSSFLVFTDGIDVGVIKITGNNGSSHVGLLGYVYLTSVGTESDPVVSVQWHPTSSQSFVTIRASAGWTLWDLVRLQSKSVVVPVSGNDLLNDVSVPPSLFKTRVENPTSVAEGVHPWTSASNVIAGKKLSPGVLAILKRGDVSPEATRHAVSSGGSFKAFCFSSDGSLAVAALSNGIKVWTIGHRCSAVSYLSSGPSSEDEWNRITAGRAIRSLVSLEDNKFVVCTDRDIGFISVEKSASHIRTLSLSTSVDLCCLSRVGSSNLILAGGRHTKTNSGVLMLLSDQSICVTPLAQESICCIAAAPTAGGNSDQVAIYAAGKSVSGGTMWTAQTLDLSIYRDRKVRLGSYEQISSEMVEASPLNEQEDDDDFPHSDAASSMAAPERLESAVTLTRPASQRDAEAIRRMKADLVESIKNDVGRIVNDEISVNLKERFAKQQRDVQSHIDKEARRMESLIEKILKEKFSSAIKSAMHEISSQIEARIDEKFEAFRRATLERNNELMGQVDELIAVAERISKHHQSCAAAGPAEPPALIEIRRFINAGEHLQAISTATQWWKLNQPIAAGQPDLLAITCAAIASQIRQGESMRDTASGCYMLLVLTEWTKLNSGSHADRTVAVLRSAKFVLSCLFASPVNVAGETMELCYKSLSKSVRNAAAIVGNGDRTVDDLSRDVLSDIREFMMRFTSSRVSTPTGSSAVVPNQPGATILQMLRRQ